VELIDTARTPDEVTSTADEETAQSGKEPAPDPEAAIEAETTDEQAAPAAGEPEALPGPAESVPVDLPPEPDAAVEPPATVEKLALQGSSDEAMTSFVDAPASQMAATAPELGATLDDKTAHEKRKVAEQAPVLTARTGGIVDPGVTPADQLPVPGDVTLEDQGKGPEVGEVSAEPYRETGSAPDTSHTRDEIQRQSSGGGFLDWLRNQFNSILNSLKTRDDSVNTSAGERKRVALTGDADVGRMEQQRQDGTAKLRSERDQKVAAFKAHPGQSNIQPRSVEEAKPATVSPETSEPIEALPADEGVADFAAAELPQEVRDAADARMGPGLQANLAEARSKTVEAARTRDADKDAEIAAAERKTAAANRQADEGQRRAVLAGRSDVARQQGAAIGDAFDNVAEFSSDAGKRQGEDQRRIASDVKTEEGKADKALDAGESEALRIKKEKEAEAAAKKAELKKKKEKEGLLDRAVGFVKDVVNKITKAIDGIFNALRSLVKKAIEAAKNAAIGFINAARKAVVDKLNGFRNWAKDKVNTYLKDRFPGIASALNKGIDATVDVAVAGVNAAADGAIAVVEAAADFLSKALDRILAAFQAGLKAAVRIAGAVLTGDFAGALRIAIEAACEIAGIDPQPIFDFMERAGEQLTAILKAPGRFINNVMTAIGTGVRQFAGNFGEHFKTGVIEWLTGALSTVPITLPAKWDIKGFFSLVAQILGLTYENIKSRVIGKFPQAAKVFDAVEAGFKYLKMLINLDFSGLWEELKGKLADLKDSIIGAIRNWSIVNIIKEGVVWLLSLMNPASALVKALKLIADLIFWLIDNLQRIKTFILSVYDAVSKIAAGILGPAANAIEKAMARSLPVVISFVASAIGLGGIGEAVRGVIQKLTAPINKMIDALIDKIVAFAKKIWGKTKEGAKATGKKAKEIKEKLLNWWSERQGFSSADGGKHELFYKGEAANAALWVASSPQPLEKFLQKKIDSSGDGEQVKVARRALKLYKTVLKTEGQLDRLQKKSSKTDAERKKIKSLVLSLRTQLKSVSDELKKVDFSAASTVQTQVTFSPGKPKSVLALPLSYLPGNTKGSPPSQDPPGWAHAAELNALEGSSGEWVRGHLLNDNLHGPGKADNLVPITKSMNASMESQVEGPAKAALRTKKELLFYDARASFWGGSGKSADFPKTVKVTWGDAEKSGSGYKKGTVRGSKPFPMSKRPPDTVKSSAPSIRGSSPSRLLSRIKTHDTAVTSYFVNSVLIPGQQSTPYASAPNMRKRLYTDQRERITTQQGEDAANTRLAYVTATYKAIVNGDITVK
jgi:phage-related protein